ncbi:MAG TPA: rod shape-determining protein MreD [Mycobacteriales bacterium]|nr:rod shape-determining protein MreD [Mycobacteriales bacterium]
MTPLARTAAGLALATSVVLQLSVVNDLRLPLGPPQLVLVTVAAIALLEGPMAGSVTGFSAGLLTDLLSAHPVGQTALVMTAVGYLLGLAYTETDRGLAVPMLAVAAGSAAALLAGAVVAALVGDNGYTAASALKGTLAAVIYDVLLILVVLPPIRGLLRWMAPERRP